MITTDTEQEAKELTEQLNELNAYRALGTVEELTERLKNAIVVDKKTQKRLIEILLYVTEYRNKEYFSPFVGVDSCGCPVIMSWQESLCRIIIDNIFKFESREAAQFYLEYRLGKKKK